MSMNSKDDRLIYLVFTAQNRLRMYIRDELMAAGLKITLVQAGILFLLEEKNGRPMSEFSRLLSLDNSTITGLIDRLEKSGEYSDAFSGEHEKKPKDQEELRRFSSEIGDKKPVWDFGCGPGETAKYLKDLGIEISGIDLSEKDWI